MMKLKPTENSQKITHQLTATLNLNAVRPQLLEKKKSFIFADYHEDTEN